MLGILYDKTFPQHAMNEETMLNTDEFNEEDDIDMEDNHQD